MQLGYVDRLEKQTIHILPKHRQSNLFDTSETTLEYINRFYKELTGLGNIQIIKIQHGNQRIIGKRAL